MARTYPLYPSAAIGDLFLLKHPRYKPEGRVLTSDELGRANFRHELPPDDVSDVGCSPGPEWTVERVGVSWVPPLPDDDRQPGWFADSMAAETAEEAMRSILRERFGHEQADPSFKAAFLAGVRYARRVAQQDRYESEKNK